MFRIHYLPSTSHWLFPPIVIGILAILLVVMAVQRAVASIKSGAPFLALRGRRFFIADWDRTRFLGTLVLFVLYILAMNWMGFLWASILFIFLYNVLYSGVEKLRDALTVFSRDNGKAGTALRSLSISLVVSVAFSTAVWYLFGHVFKITLP